MILTTLHVLKIIFGLFHLIDWLGFYKYQQQFDFHLKLESDSSQKDQCLHATSLCCCDERVGQLTETIRPLFNQNSRWHCVLSSYWRLSCLAALPLRMCNTHNCRLFPWHEVVTQTRSQASYTLSATRLQEVQACCSCSIMFVRFFKSHQGNELHTPAPSQSTAWVFG